MSLTSSIRKNNICTLHISYISSSHTILLNTDLPMLILHYILRLRPFVHVYIYTFSKMIFSSFIMIIYCHVVIVNNIIKNFFLEFLVIVNSLNYTVIIQSPTIHTLIFMSPLYFQFNYPNNNVLSHWMPGNTRSGDTVILTTILSLFNIKINMS